MLFLPSDHNNRNWNSYHTSVRCYNVQPGRLFTFSKCCCAFYKAYSYALPYFGGNKPICTVGKLRHLWDCWLRVACSQWSRGVPCLLPPLFRLPHFFSEFGRSACLHSARRFLAVSLIIINILNVLELITISLRFNSFALHLQCCWQHYNPLSPGAVIWE